jgi:hypothetical protein
MIHASLFQPNIYPLGAGKPGSISRCQAIEPTAATNFQRIKEIGRLATVGYVRKIPTVTYRMTQTEYGSFGFWQQITNQASTVDTMTLENFKTTAFDIAAFLTDDMGQAYRGVMLYPYMRTSGFSLNIGNPDATAERTFSFVGEQAITFEAPYGTPGVNPYYVEIDKVAGSAEDDTIELQYGTANSPLEDPDVPEVTAYSLAQRFIFRVTVYVPSTGITTWLVPEVDYTYDGSNAMVLTGVTIPTEAGNIYKVWVVMAALPTSASQVAGQTAFPTALFTQDNTDAAGINATSTSLFLYVPGSGQPGSQDYLYRVQSAVIDVTFERADLKEIGNRNIVQMGINLNKVNIKIGRLLEKFTIDEVLRGCVPGYGKLDIENYSTNLSFIVKIFADDTKQTLLYGMFASQLAPMDVGQGVPVNAYVKDNCTLDGESLTISRDNAQLGEAGFEGPTPTIV